ncbi:MAG: hypothetical protein WKF84_22770 [Pyrinomonadaceae bacterium]
MKFNANLASILSLTVFMPYVVSLLIFTIVHKVNMSLATLLGLVAIPFTFLLTVAGVLIPARHDVSTEGFSILFYSVVAFGTVAHLAVGLAVYSAVILYTVVTSSASI